MGRTGRTLADALTEFDIGYAAIERDQQRLREAWPTATMSRSGI